jgi:hypothetical protein
MPKVLKELPCQGEILCHFEVLCLIKPCHCVWIYEGMSGMPLQKFLPELKGLVRRSTDLDLILKIRYPLYCHAILVEVAIWSALPSVQLECVMECMIECTALKLSEYGVRG